MVRAMSDPAEQLRILRNEEKAARDTQVAEELALVDRLAVTLGTPRSEARGSQDDTSPAAP